jgi:hypothetical protein
MCTVLEFDTIEIITGWHDRCYDTPNSIVPLFLRARGKRIAMCALRSNVGRFTLALLAFAATRKGVRGIDSRSPSYCRGCDD